MGKVHSITGFSYLPRSNSHYGNVRNYEFYGSINADFYELLHKGTFHAGTIERIVIFNQKKCRLIKFRAISEMKGNPWTDVAELNVFGNYILPVSFPG